MVLVEWFKDVFGYGRRVFGSFMLMFRDSFKGMVLEGINNKLVIKCV